MGNNFDLMRECIEAASVGMIFGRRVVCTEIMQATKPMPGLSISADIDVSEKFRKQFECWSIRLFGGLSEIVTTADAMFMNKNTFRFVFDQIEAEREKRNG